MWKISIAFCGNFVELTEYERSIDVLSVLSYRTQFTVNNFVLRFHGRHFLRRLSSVLGHCSINAITLYKHYKALQ